MRWPIPSASHHKPPNSTERRVSSLANMNDGIGQPAWHSIVPRGLLWMWKQLKHEFMYRELDTHQNWELHLHIRVAHSQLFVYILFIWWRLLERTQAAAAAAYENVECGRLFERKQEHGNRVICMRGNERERESAHAKLTREYYYYFWCASWARLPAANLQHKIVALAQLALVP